MQEEIYYPKNNLWISSDPETEHNTFSNTEIDNIVYYETSPSDIINIIPTEEIEKESIPHFQPNIFSENFETYRTPLETIPKGTDIEVLILGQTGSGKTTFFNTAANYFLGGSFGIKPQEQRIEVMIPTRFLKSTNTNCSHSENNVNDQGKSQTSKPKAYKLSIADRSITFIDTPGMGDTEGIARDEKHLRNILKKSSKRGKLSGIILFFNGAEARNNATQDYSFKKLLGLIPNVAIKNIVVVLTNTYKYSCNFPLQPILDLGVSQDRIFYMNNSVLSSHPRFWLDTEIARHLTQDWKDSMKTLGDICEKLSESSGIISNEFKKMCDLRNTVMAEFQSLRINFASIQETQNTIELFKQKILSHTAIAEDFKDFAQKATVKTIKFVVDSNRHYSTICSVHNTTCHDECNLSETHIIGDKIFTGCIAFNSSGGVKCSVCSKGEACSYEKHYHARGKFKTVTKTLQDKLKEYKKQHDDASNAIKSVEGEINSAEDALAQINATIDQFTEDVRDTLEELKSICKGYNFVAELNATINLLKQEISTYTSFEARNKAEEFVTALKIMAEMLTEQGYDQINAKDYNVSGHQISAKKLLESNSVISLVKFGIGKLKKKN